MINVKTKKTLGTVSQKRAILKQIENIKKSQKSNKCFLDEFAGLLEDVEKGKTSKDLLKD